MNGIWTPICGLHFGKNNLSSCAAIYCRKLDLEFNNTGMNTLLVGLRDLPFETNTIRFGHCLSLDECNLDTVRPRLVRSFVPEICRTK